DFFVEEFVITEGLEVDNNGRALGVFGDQVQIDRVLLLDLAPQRRQGGGIGGNLRDQQGRERQVGDRVRDIGEAAHALYPVDLLDLLRDPADFFQGGRGIHVFRDQADHGDIVIAKEPAGLVIVLLLRVVSW